QEMKSRDPLLAAWQETLGAKSDAPAIFDTSGAILRSFRQIEEMANAYEPGMNRFCAGQVVAIQIGNHQDWPSILLAGLRRKLVVLPLERSISKHERETALRICRASAVVAPKAFGAQSVEILPLGTAASTEKIDWRNDPPSLLKLT